MVEERQKGEGSRRERERETVGRVLGLKGKRGERGEKEGKSRKVCVYSESDSRGEESEKPVVS